MASRLLQQSLAGVQSQTRGAPDEGSGAHASLPASQPRADDGTWQHDKFGDAAPRPRPHKQAAAGGTLATKVAIDDLHYDVAQDELAGLLSGIGPLAKGPFIKFDASGRSTGHATVWYQSEDDAVAASREFDGSRAKGQTLRVAVLETAPLFVRTARQAERRREDAPGRGALRGAPGRSRGARARATTTLVERLQSDAGRPRDSAPRPKRRGAARVGGRAEAARRPASAAELDAELDAFMVGPSERTDADEAMDVQ
ncbi:hypothetical protein MSPP1_001891 [Malassezia sp. CBS 17886]|nr:hypothetical protein MSPP1_001891 [Malassezia sp. CBS 17886]